MFTQRSLGDKLLGERDAETFCSPAGQSTRENQVKTLCMMSSFLVVRFLDFPSWFAFTKMIISKWVININNE